jgi:ATP-binding cassette subfamily B (MDR/TAP) protein 1
LRYLRHVLHQPISYFDTNAPGTIATSLTNDTSVVQVGLAEKLAIVFQALTMMVCALIIGFTQNWKLMFATITPIPWVIVTTGYFGGLNAKVQSQVSTTLNLASGIAEEALSSAVNITAMGAADKIVRRYAEHITQGMRQWTPTGPIFAFIYGNSKLLVCSKRGIVVDRA